MSKAANPPSQTQSRNETARWPEGVSARCKITDKLVVEIPLQFVRTAYFFRNEPRPALVPLSELPIVENIQFDFFLPHFSGYTLENYENQFDPNKVEVIHLSAGDPREAEPDGPGSYPPNMLKRLFRAHLLNPDDYQDSYGLRCYRNKLLPKKITCYGQRDAPGHEDIMIDVLVPPYQPGITFPTMQAQYFSRRYGGVEVAWRSHAGNLARWHDIDSQIWKFLDAWNVASPKVR